jgi:hypothetical protein
LPFARRSWPPTGARAVARRWLLGCRPFARTRTHGRTPRLARRRPGVCSVTARADPERPTRLPSGLRPAWSRGRPYGR